MKYLSLYDYLGKAAGEQLGLEVAAEARKHGIQTQSREISNPNFTGTVLLYPKDFLEFYFREPDSIHVEDDYFPSVGDVQDYDDLPF
jgi:hypothetical protein